MGLLLPAHLRVVFMNNILSIDTILPTPGLETEVLSTTSRRQSVLHTSLGVLILE